MSDHAAARPADADRVTVYADFNCPWSYLAWRRSEVLAEDGVEVDWRAVEHEPWHPLGPGHLATRAQALHDELAEVSEHLLPGERLPHPFPAFVPFTAAATAAYAEASLVGVAAEARRKLFEAFWLHDQDLNDGRVVRSLLADTVRGRPSRIELIHLWGYAVDVTGGPVTSDGWRTVRLWRAEWESIGPVVPTVVLGSGDPVAGREAVDLLAGQLTARGLDVSEGSRAASTAGAA